MVIVFVAIYMLGESCQRVWLV